MTATSCFSSDHADILNSCQYKCGGCTCIFESLIWLHCHLRDHDEGGSYVFNNRIQTAYPVRISVDKSTQTCLEDLEYIINRKTAEINVSLETVTDTVKIQATCNEIYSDSDHAKIAKERRTTDSGVVKQEFPSDDSRSLLNAQMDDDGTTKHTENQTMTYQTSEIKEEPNILHKESRALLGNVSINTGLCLNDEDEVELPLSVPTEFIEKLTEPESKRFKSMECKTKKEMVKSKTRHMERKAKHETHSLCTVVNSNVIERQTRSKTYTMSAEDLENFKGVQEEMKQMIDGESKKVNTKHSQINSSKMKTNDKDTKETVQGAEKPKVSCDICDKKVRPSTMQRHLYRCHGVPKKKLGRPKHIDYFYKCDKCNKLVRTMRRSNHTKRHLRKENNETKESDVASIMCHICGKLVTAASHLKRHMIIHSANRLNCQMCDYVAPTEARLDYHKRQHFKVDCQVCGKVVLQRNLNKHIRRDHMGERRYSCEICPKAFFSKDKLETHKAVHFAPTYACAYCDRKFNNRGSMARHEMTHTGEKRYFCQICNHGFIQSTPYWLHMKKQHSIEKSEAMAMIEKQIDQKTRLGPSAS